jgi:Zn finger protein HypA/HybF involved in hydrogenase expression
MHFRKPNRSTSKKNPYKALHKTWESLEEYELAAGQTTTRGLLFKTAKLAEKITPFEIECGHCRKISPIRAFCGEDIDGQLKCPKCRKWNFVLPDISIDESAIYETKRGVKLADDQVACSHCGTVNRVSSFEHSATEKDTVSCPDCHGLLVIL